MVGCQSTMHESYAAAKMQPESLLDALARPLESEKSRFG